ncbi:MAG: hypothetical protein ACRCXA_03580 [Peptostreptococcaceae bacterium]
MTSNNLNNHNDSNLELESNYPLFTALLASGAIISIATLLNSKSRKFVFSTFKFIGKQQLKLLAGVGIFSIATFISNNIFCEDEYYCDEDEIILNNIKE